MGKVKWFGPQILPDLSSVDQTVPNNWLLLSQCETVPPESIDQMTKLYMSSVINNSWKNSPADQVQI